MNKPVQIERPAPPRITKADAMRRVIQELQQERGSRALLCRLVGVSPQAMDNWPDDGDIPELFARRLKDMRPAWFETAQA